MLQSLVYPEVRIREGSHFQQVPNYVVAAELLHDGQFVTYDGEYHVATQRPTHCVHRSGVHRNTAEEIRLYTGTVQAGEPVMAFTGSGVATIPFASDVVAGDYLTVNASGYAVKWEANEAAYLIGQATTDVTIPEGETLAWGEAWLTLPAQYVVTPQA